MLYFGLHCFITWFFHFQSHNLVFSFCEILYLYKTQTFILSLSSADLKKILNFSRDSQFDDGGKKLTVLYLLLKASNHMFQYSFNKNTLRYKIPVIIKQSGISKLQTNASPRHLPTSNPYVFCPLVQTKHWGARLKL